jgi:UDP-glucose:(heptosyl)LPS alpha-1,3-glucosyltransferase
MVNRLGIKEHVYFLGPKTDVERYYCASDLFVFPTIYDPFSNVCLEAMASGLPVITSRVNGASELLKAGKNGYIIDNPVDPIEISRKIQKGLKLNRRSVQEFNSKLLERLSWERHLEQVLDIYGNIRKKSRFHA